MKIKKELIKGVIKKNFENIILDVEMTDSSVVPCFCYDGRSAEELLQPGNVVYMSHRDNPLRKIKYEAEFVRKNDVLAFVDPRYNEELFVEAINNKVIKDFDEYVDIKKITDIDETKYASFELVKENGKKLFLYIDNFYKKIDDNVVFPYSLDFLKMSLLEEFHQLRQEGHETAGVFIIPRGDCNKVKFVWNIDPTASAKIYDEAKNGLKFFCYACNVSLTEVNIDKKMEIVF